MVKTKYLLTALICGLLFPLVSLDSAHALPTLTWAEAKNSPVLKQLRQQPTFPVTVLDVAVHNGFPAATKLADDTLLVAYRQAKWHWDDEGNNPRKCVFTYSFDKGITWTEPKVKRVPGTHELADCGGLSTPTYGPLTGLPVMVIHGHDDNHANMTQISVAKDPAGNEWEDAFMLPYTSKNENSFPSSVAVQISATDFVVAAYAIDGGNLVSTTVRREAGGWKIIGTGYIAKDSDLKGDGISYSEVGVVAIGSGAGSSSPPKLVATLRQEERKTGPKHVGVSFSDDGGKTWTRPRDAFIGYGDPLPAWVSGNTIVVSYRRLPSYLGGLDPAHAMYRISTDAGQTWSDEYLYGPAESKMAYGVFVPYSAKEIIGIYGAEIGGNEAIIRRSVIDINNPVPSADRWFGVRDIDTAVAISQKSFSKSDTVYIANNVGFHDALVTVPQAAKTQSPLLLSAPDGIDDVVLTEIGRLAAKNVVLLGGKKALATTVENQIRAKFPKAGIRRYAGASHFDTAIAVTANGQIGKDLYLANDVAFADALAAGPIAGRTGANIMLVPPKGEIPAEVIAEIVRLKPANIFGVGGSFAIGATVLAQVEKATGKKVTRIAGDTERQTAQKLALAILPPKEVMFTNQLSFQDSLAVGPAAAKRNGVILLTDGECLSERELRTFFGFQPAAGHLIGGKRAMAPALERLSLCR